MDYLCKPKQHSNGCCFLVELMLFHMYSKLTFIGSYNNIIKISIVWKHTLSTNRLIIEVTKEHHRVLFSLLRLSKGGLCAVLYNANRYVLNIKVKDV